MLPFPAGEKDCKYLSPSLPINTAEFPYCAAYEHNFIDHPPSNATDMAVNEEMQREYLKTMDMITAWRANKNGLPQPEGPKTEKLLTKVSPPELLGATAQSCKPIGALEQCAQTTARGTQRGSAPSIVALAASM